MSPNRKVGVPTGILGLRTLVLLEFAVDEVPLVAPFTTLPLVAEVPAAFLTGRSSQPQPEVMATRTTRGPKVIVILSAATTKVEIGDVELMVMGLILNNWLLVEVSKVCGCGGGFQPSELYPHRL